MGPHFYNSNRGVCACYFQVEGREASDGWAKRGGFLMTIDLSYDPSKASALECWANDISKLSFGECTFCQKATTIYWSEFFQAFACAGCLNHLEPILWKREVES